MKPQRFLCTLLAAALLVNSAHAQDKIANVLSDPALDMKRPADRAEAVKRMKEVEDKDLEKAKQIAKRRGMPFREELPNGRSRVLVGVDDDGELLYYEDRNTNAAISTAANRIHTSPYSIDGSGVRVGVWENSSPLNTHQEFNDGPTSRINLVQSTASGDHATHVAGIIGAFGVTTGAKGMAYQTIVDAYTSGSDSSEMTAAGAIGPGQHAAKVYVSNHSYGFTYGWRSSGGVMTWSGTGTDQNAYDPDFGKYNGTSRSFDSIHYNTPYYLAFWAAGNENTDGPNSGQSCVIGGNTVSYNPATHPQNDGQYSGGFDTLGDHTTAKNVMVIGAANDAVTGGQRDPAKATIAGFSSTGPCDDGRIKPDVVGNGVSLYSPISTSDTSYASYQGTSMSTPNVCGTAALLVDLYRSLNSGGAMRASTLRGLLIHTATDIGRPGPDYTYGWGLVDGGKAADLIKRQADYPDLKSIVEDQLTPSEPTKTVIFSWDGVSPIRATLAWTDPAGTADTGHNDRTPDLVNDLNLKLIAPNGTEYYPFVMPFVGTWTIASMSANATTGINHVDNAEQVLINSPGQSGAWQAQISYVGGLTDNVQQYGLLISGSDSVGALAFSPASYTVNENAGTAAISVSRVGGSSGAASVNYSTSNGTALAGSDYTATSGTLSWNDGEDGSKTINIPILNDGTSETYAETVQVTLSNPSGITISGSNPAILNILDDETLMGVTSFNNGGSYVTNTQQDITWASGLGGNVRIELLKNGINYTTLASSTANDGLFSWTIPTLVPTGSDYSIRITSLAGGGESDESDGTFSIQNQVSGTIYSADMSTNPGWTLEGAWAHGVPTGTSGDPSSGKTGSNVIGFNLNGAYGNSLPETYATTPAIDCSGYTNVQLSFQRWLRVEDSQYDKASIQVSNGTAWTTIWAHSGGNLLDSSWQSLTYDISAVADGSPTVYIRWVMGTTDGSVVYGGWNIDDVVVSGFGEAINPAGEVAFSTANFQASENAGTATITVNRTLGTSGAISVDYSTSNGTALPGSDYTATSGTLNWANGDGEAKTFSVPITNDSTREDFLETVTLSLTNTVGGTIVGTNPATLTIQDDDNNVPVVSAGADQFTTLQQVTITPGLHYGTVPGNIDTNTPNPNTTILINVASETENAIAGNTTEIYTGSIYDADGQISFTEHIDDKARIWIDGVLVLSNDTWNARSSTANLNLSPGWHDIEIRISNGTGGSGPVASPGIGYDPAGGTAWQTLVDPGDGSLLRTEQAIPSAQVILAGTASDLDSDQLTTTWSMFSGPAPVTFGDASFLDTTATFSQEGIYTLRLTADDGRDPASDDMVVTVGSSGLALSIESASIAENGGSSNSTVTRPGTTGDLVVSLVSSDTSEATVPASVTILDGQTSAGFTITAQDDALVDGTQMVTITASAAGNPDATDTIDVTDNEVAVLTLNIAAASVSESDGAGATTATVTRNTPTAGEMVVNLSSNDTSEATVPSTVTIAAGQATSPAFNINAVDDSVVDGTQTVTITASYAGHSNGTDTLDVTDDAPYTLTVVTGAGGASTSGGGSKDPDESPHAVSATAATGYLFGNWTVTSGSGTVDNPNSANTFVFANSNTTVQANFQIITYTVGYDGNANTGGTAPGNQTKTYGVDLTLLGPGDLVKTGHTFSGWNTQANGGGTSYPAGGTYPANANATLYAQWAPDTYIVTYNGNGSTTGMAPADGEKIHDVDLTLATNSGNLTKTGYSFAGWNTADNGSGINYSAGGIYTDNAALALYAKWTAGADGTWAQTTAGPFDWGTAGNWSGNIVASGADRTAFFTPNITPDQVVNLEAPRTIGDIIFTDSTTNSSNLTISGSSVLTLSRSSGAPVIDVTQSNRTLTISSPISGSNGLQKNGPGTLTLSGANDYTGGTTLNGGTLTVNSNAALGAATTSVTANASSALTSSAAANVDYTRAISLGANTLTLRNTTNSTTASFSGAITGSGGVTVVAGGTTSTVALSNTGNDFTGNLTLSNTGNTNLFASFSSIGDGGTISTGVGGWRRVIQYTGDSNLVLNTRRIDLNSSFQNVYDGGGQPINMFENNGAGTVTFNANLTISDNRTGTFFLGGSNTGNNTFGGVIPNSTGGTLSIAKHGVGKWILTRDNTFAGNAIASGGTLSVAKIADATVAQPLGVGSIIQIGDRGNTGNLEFAGSTNTVTDKQIQLGGTQNNLTGGGGILNNGTGALHFDNPTFNSPHATATGTRTLTLGGSNTGANTISGAIQNNNTGGNGLLALTKSGDGTWLLGGDNSYTGPTAITAGKLFLNGDQTLATGNVSVSANATLGGTGTIGGNTTIAANGRLEFDLSTAAAGHNPLNVTSGKTLAFSGASELTITSGGGAAPGTYTLITGGNNITGSAPATLNLPSGWAATVSISGNSLLLNVTSTGGPGPVDHFVISPITSPQTVGTAITGITITAQDAANETATSFTGTVTFGGTAGITGTSAAFSEGVLSNVSVTPANAGSPVTLTVSDGAGHTGSVSFTVQSLYDAWAAQTFANPFTDITSTGNPDGDSLNNLQEFAFGMDPTKPDFSTVTYVDGGDVTKAGVPVIRNFAAAGQAADWRAVFARRKDHAAAGLTYSAIFSADLDLWTPNAATPTRLTGESSAGAMEAVSIPFPATVPLQSGGSATPKFFRIGTTGN